MDSNNQLIYKGFDIPEGAIIEPNPGKGKLNGEYTIYDSNKKNVIAKLQYKKNQLSGDCQLFESPQIFEKRPYLKDIANGWGIVYENDKETKRYLYKDGKRIIMLEQEKETKFKRETDCQNGQLLSFCEYDDKFNRINTGYMFKDNKIEKACVFVDGKENRIVKEFHDNNMTEYNENGVVIYKGEYLDNIECEYCRNGKGDEYEDNCILYSGEWKNNKREGKGKSYNKNVLVYEGEWKNSKPNGFGKLYDKDGKVLHEGNWDNGTLKEANDVITYSDHGIQKQAVKDDVRELPLKQSAVKKTNDKKSCCCWTIVVLILLAIGGVIGYFMWKNKIESVSVVTSQKEFDKLSKYSQHISFAKESCNENTFTNLDFSRFIDLQSIEVGDNSLMYVKNVKIDGLSKLEKVNIGQNSFTENRNGYASNSQDNNFIMKNCDSLKSLSIDRYSFSNYNSFIVESKIVVRV